MILPEAAGSGEWLETTAFPSPPRSVLTCHLSLKNWRHHMPGCLCPSSLLMTQGGIPPWLRVGGRGGCKSAVPQSAEDMCACPHLLSPPCISQRGQGHPIVPGSVAETSQVCLNNLMHILRRWKLCSLWKLAWPLLPGWQLCSGAPWGWSPHPHGAGEAPALPWQGSLVGVQDQSGGPSLLLTALCFSCETYFVLCFSIFCALLIMQPAFASMCK